MSIDRTIGIAVLSQYLSIRSNIELLEQRIFAASATPAQYAANVYACAGYLTNGWVSEYNADIKQALTGFRLNAYFEHASAESETDQYLVEDICVDEGVLSCPRCKSAKTFSYTKQVRSCDEGTSVFARCYNCAHKWRES